MLIYVLCGGHLGFPISIKSAEISKILFSEIETNELTEPKL
jgi:hypothetical protein